MMRRIIVLAGLALIALSIGHVQAQKPAGEQWPNYQYNSNFSPLTQITPENVGDWLGAGAAAVGIGTALVGPGTGRLDARTLQARIEILRQGLAAR